MIKVEKISDSSKNFLSSNKLEDDVARFWTQHFNTDKNGIRLYYFDSLPELEEGQAYNLDEQGKIKPCEPAYITVPSLDEQGQIILDENGDTVLEQQRDSLNDTILSGEVTGQLLNWCYDDNMNFIGYGI